MRDIREYLGLKVSFSLNPRRYSTLATKRQSDLQLVLKGVPIVSIEVKPKLAEEGDDLRHQEAQLLK